MKETIINLKKVYKYGKEYKKNLIYQILCCMIGIAINIIDPLLYAKFIYYFTSLKFQKAMIVIIIILGVYLLDEFKQLIIRRNTQVFRRGTIRNIQMALGKETLRLEQYILDKNSSGKLIQRIMNDTDNMAMMFTRGMGRVTSLLSNIGAFIAVLILDYHMFIYYLVAAITLTVLFYIKNEKVGEKAKEYKAQSDKVAGLTGELVRGARDIKMLYAKKSFLKELDSKVVKQSELNFETRNIDMNYNLFINSLKYILLFISIVLLIILINNNTITIAVALALFNYKDRVLTNLMENISNFFEETKEFNISSERVFEVLENNKIFVKEKFGKNHIDRIIGRFEFKDVEFSYNEENKVLKKLNLKVEENKTYGIVGKSGSGKTTLFNLLCRIYDYDKGKISIDEIDIKELDEESIRGNITIISQNPYIFNLSIKDNFKLVKEDITDEEIINACKLSCLDDFINTLPEGYDTLVGEGGVNLSGGQRQRLAIARAMVQKTKIILFDEATSALDNETQNKIQKAINNLKENFTVVIIAHRLSTIINCEKIFFMEKGKITASGSHKELLEKCKKYKDLYEYEIVENK